MIKKRLLGGRKSFQMSKEVIEMIFGIEKLQCLNEEQKRFQDHIEVCITMQDAMCIHYSFKPSFLFAEQELKAIYELLPNITESFTGELANAVNVYTKTLLSLREYLNKKNIGIVMDKFTEDIIKKTRERITLNRSF